MALFGDVGRAVEEFVGSASKDKKERSIPGPSAEETKMNNIIMQAILPAYFEAAGYSLETNASGQFVLKPLIPKDIQKLREKHGENSRQYREAIEKYESEQVLKEENIRRQEQLYQENSLKFMKGDFSTTEEQRRGIEDVLTPQRIAMEAVFGKSGDANKNIQQYVSKARETGMSLGDFTEAIVPQIQQGGTLDDALTQVIEVNRQLMKMGIEDVTGEMTKRVNQQAVALGRDPTDPAFQQELQQLAAREVQKGQLQLAKIESEGRMNIAQQKAQAELNLGQQASQLRTQVGGGMFSKQTAARQFQEALKNQSLQNLMSGYQIPSNLSSQMANIRLGQPTVQSRPSLIEGVTEVISGGLQAAAGAKGAG